MNQPRDLPRFRPQQLLEYGFSVADLDLDLDRDLDDDEARSEAAFSSTLNRVFERLIARSGDPLWLGIVETIEPGSSAWMDVLGTSVVTLSERANWWPGTERLSLGDTRVRAVPVEAFGRAWQSLKAPMGEGFYPAFDPFLFSRYRDGDLCVLQTVGHEGMASCLVAEDDVEVAQWLRSLGFSRADSRWQAPSGAGAHRLCGVRSRDELVEIFGEESVAWIERKAGG